MKLGSFCTGYGGLDMAVEHHYGADLAWYSEVDKDCNNLLATRFPGVPNVGDLTTIDWDQVEPVDIMCAGFNTAAPLDKTEAWNALKNGFS